MCIDQTRPIYKNEFGTRRSTCEINRFISRIMQLAVVLGGSLRMVGNYKIGVIVLAYRVEHQIRDALKSMPSFVDRIYVVDDGSPDKTAALVKSLSDSRIRLIQHRTNQGPGAALSTGYHAALEDDIDVMIKVDGDGQMPTEQMEDLITPIIEGKVDYAKGNRLSTSEHYQSMPRFRLFGNLMLTWLSRIASGYWQLNDAQNGFTAISKQALKTINLNLYPRYGYLNDLLVQLNVHGYRILDVPMPARYGTEKSAIRLKTYIPKIASLLLRKFCWRLWRKYFSMPR